MKMTWVLLGLFITSTSTLTAENIPIAVSKPSPAKQPEHYRGIGELEGSIKAIDATGKLVWIVDSSDKESQLRFTKDTQITNKNNIYLGFNDLQKGDIIHVYFNTSDNTARQVDLVGKKLLPS